MPTWPCGDIVDIPTEPLVLGSLEVLPATFGFLLVELSEPVLQLDQDRTSKERSDSDIRESELVPKDVLSFLDRRELVLDRVESFEESVVGAGSEGPPAQAGLDLVADRIQEESDFGFAYGILGEQVRLRSEVSEELNQNQGFGQLR